MPPSPPSPTPPPHPPSTNVPKPSWLGSYPNAACSGPVGPNVVHDTQENVCIKFTPTPGMAWVGINYGSGIDHVNVVSFFVDDGCKYVIGGPMGAGYVYQGDTGSGMKCSKDLGAAKSIMVQSKMQ